MKNVSKKLQSEGFNGKFIGTVEIRWNYRKKIDIVHNGNINDTEEVAFYYHIVEGRVNGRVFKSAEFLNENLVWQHIDEIEKKVEIELHLLANALKPLSLDDMLAQRGYK